MLHTGNETKVPSSNCVFFCLRTIIQKLPKQFTVNNPSAQKQPRQMTGPTQFTISNTQAMTQGGRPNAKKPTVSLGAEGLQVTTINKSAKKVINPVDSCSELIQFRKTFISILS